MMLARRILVVDDDRLQVETLGDILELHGWEVRGAHSGREAIAAAKEGCYGLVLMDIKMPEMSGVTAFKAMKVDRPDIKVLLMTAHADEDLIREAEGAGAIRVLSKPLQLAVLLAVLAQQLVPSSGY